MSCNTSYSGPKILDPNSPVFGIFYALFVYFGVKMTLGFFSGAVVLHNLGDGALHMPAQCNEDHTQSTGRDVPCYQVACLRDNRLLQ